MRRHLLLAAAALGALMLVACSGDTPDGPGGEPVPEVERTPAEPQVTGKVVILSSRDEKFMRPLWEEVRRRHPKLELVVDYGKDAAYLDRIRSEGGSPQADLFLSKGSAAATAAAGEGLLEPLPQDLLDRVPERFRGDGGRWVGLSARARIIVARRILASKPQSVTDLASPRFKGRLARTVATNSSFVGGVTAMLAQLGEANTRDLLIGIDSNSEGNVHPKHTPAVAAVAEGQADLALVNHYYFYRRVLGKDFDPSLSAADAERQIAEANIEAIYPDADAGGVAWNVTGGAVITGASNRGQALAVLRVLLSADGQQAYAWTNREYPVVDGVPSAPGVRSADTFNWSDVPLPELAAHNDAAVALIQELGLE